MFRVLCLLVLFFLASCHRTPRTLEPHVVAPPHPKEVRRERRVAMELPEGFSRSPFAPLTAEEAGTEWGKEYRLALVFAEDFDLYRAITGFKRALYFLPAEARERRLEIEYDIALAYYLGHKYLDAVYSVEGTELVQVGREFPAFSDLLLLLYDSYWELGRFEQADHILALIEGEEAAQLSRLASVRRVEVSALGNEPVIETYRCGAKSIGKAELMQAVLPGAGYWYVGMKQTAVTSFLINGLFIGAAAHFFADGNAAAGIITLSLETGWYFGGIYGAGLAARSYNERLYETCADRICQRDGLFPIMMLKYSF